MMGLIKKIAGLGLLVAAILGAFYLNDLRQLSERKAYKERLLSELSVTLNRELGDISVIQENLRGCLAAVDLLIADMADRRRSIEKRKIAEDYLLVSQKMYTSFFPQSGTYEQFLSSESMELVGSDKLRQVLLDTYTHLLNRNNALSRTLDDYYLRLTDSFGSYITVVPAEMKTHGFVYSNKKIKNFSVDDSFYRSRAHLSVLIETRNLISNYLNLLDRFTESYGQLIVHSKEEIAR